MSTVKNNPLFTDADRDRNSRFISIKGFILLRIKYKLFIKEMVKLKISFLPKSRLGKWAVIMMILNCALFVVGSVLPWKPGYSGFEIVIQNPLQAIITILMLAVGIATFSMALISVIKNKERSILAFLAILLGLYSILGFFGSIASVFISSQ